MNSTEYKHDAKHKQGELSKNLITNDFNLTTSASTSPI